VQGQETVLGLAAVYSSVRYIADAIASLPIKVYRQLPDGTAQRIYSSMLLGSPIAGGGPQVSGTLYDWLFEGSTSALLHGNAWGLVTNRGGIAGPDGNGLPTGVAWLPPERMSVQDDEMQPENPLRARIYYNGRTMNRSELIQLKAFSVAGRVEGISPIRMFATLWSQGLSALKYSSDWFDAGGFPPGTFRNISEEVDEVQAKEIRRRLTDTIRLRQPLVFGRDWEYREITVPPNEAAFIQAMQLNATQVAAIFGVRPQRVGGTQNDGLHYTSQVMDQLDEVTNTLRPWLTRWEHLLTSLLPSTQYARFDTDALLKMDPKTRTEVYQIQRNTGIRSANEIRGEDDLPEVPGGDDPLPLPVLERMISTTRSIPKSYLPLMVLEADMIADRLGKLADEHPNLVNPATTARPPLNKTPEQYLAGLITQIRSGQLFGPPEAKAADSDRASALTMLAQYEKMGQLSAEEAAGRMARAHGAETTGQLAELFAGLPPMPDGVAPSVSRETFGPAEIRASDADRRHARDLLAAHAKAGRLRPAELDERSRKAGEAVTCGDLGTLFADLPVAELAASAPEEDRSGGARQPLFGPAALALLHARATDETAALAAMNGKAH
jgi:HK97 family phage portal protein